MTTDPLESVLYLEDEYHQTGFAEGVAVGTSAGFWEAYALGIEKGFQKGFDIGVIRGRTAVWTSRSRQSPIAKQQTIRSLTDGLKDGPASRSGDISDFRLRLRSRPTSTAPSSQLDPNPSLTPVSLPSISQGRVDRHISVLSSTLDPVAISTENSDEAVDEADDRLRRATAKARLVDRLLDDQFDATFDLVRTHRLSSSTSAPAPTADGGQKPSPNRAIRLRPPIGENNIEDFGL